MAERQNREKNDYQIGVRDLKNNLTKIVSSVREHHHEYVVTVHGKPVAVLRPYTEADTARLRENESTQELMELQQLSEMVTEAWQETASGTALLEQMRKESAWR